MKFQTLTNIEINDLVSEGFGLARHDNKVIFIPFSAPGDVADIKITRDKRKFAEAELVNIVQPSPIRKEAFCQHFGVCGGCKLQHIDYSAQLTFKAKQVKDNLERIGKIELPDIAPILGSAQQQYYRNKLEYTFSNKSWLTNEQIKSGQEFDRNALGFHIPGKFDKVLNIETCYLQADPSNAIRNSLMDYARKNKLTFFDIREQNGLLRNLIIRTSNTGELMVIVQVFEKDMENVSGIMNHLKNNFPEITSLNYIINQKKNETFFDQEVMTWHGKDHISEKMEHLTYRVGPKSFFQTNSSQAYELYKITRDFAGLNGNEVVYDLYTGTGTIANFVAHLAKKVIGIEYVEMAIEDAKINSELNKITNTEFFAGDMKDILTDAFIAQKGKPDVIITDPPRAGMHEDVVKTILNTGVQKIVYVSCNPATQARDIELMKEHYKVTRVQPVDMFPHTHHVENVVLLEKV